MPVTLHSLSGSPYAWRVALALEHKRIPYTQRLLSLDAGDFKQPAFRALNPRQRVPVLVDDDFVLYESAAIVEYLDDSRPGEPRLFSADLRQRALQRRMVREADQYFATAMEHLVDAVLFTPAEHWSDERIATAYAEIRQELARWEEAAGGEHLAGPLSAVDFTLFPQIALVLRIAGRKPDPVAAFAVGPRVGAWMDRMQALPLVQTTWPPHWRAQAPAS